MMVQAVSYAINRTVLQVCVSQFVSRFLGESEKMLEALFDLAKENAPSLIVMEEVDSIGRTRSSDEPDTERRIKSEFLRHLDEMEEDVAFLATTNLPWELDPSFLRRFEKKVFVPVLNKSDRAQLIRNLTEQNLSLTSGQKEDLAMASKGLTGFEIEREINDLFMLSNSRAEQFNFDFPSLKKKMLQTKPSVSSKLLGRYIKFLEMQGESSQLLDIDPNLIEVKVPQHYI